MTIQTYYTNNHPSLSNTQHEVIDTAWLIFRQFKSSGLIFSLRKFPRIVFSSGISAHLTVARALALPRTQDLVRHHPRAIFKYLGNYLARSFTVDTRSAILANHYHYLNKYVTSGFMNQVCEGHIPLWQACEETGQYQISLAYSNSGYKEGELSLFFTLNATLVFTLSFTVAPGRLLGVQAEQIILVSRLQGSRTGREVIRLAAKSFHENSPPVMLLSALQGIADCLNISGIVGINAREQICVDDASPEGQAASTYDGFWRSTGATRLDNGMFHLSGDVPETPLSSIKSNHRSRVKRKRQFKAMLREQIGQAFKQSSLN